MYNGKKTLGVRLTWDKRYITLAPVATLLGLAFHLHDPDHLLGEDENLGITLALVPADYPGVEIGRRHIPARSAFMNGPTRGQERLHPDGFPDRRPAVCGAGLAHADGVPLDRPRHLAAGDRHRARSSRRCASPPPMPASAASSALPVGIMEGVAEPLAPDGQATPTCTRRRAR